MPIWRYPSARLVIQGASIFYRDKRYRFLREIEALMPVITSDVEQFFTSLRNQAVKSAS
jgi:hypothetical protein